MRRRLKILYAVLFFAVCAAPCAAMLLGYQSPNYEKRALAQPPAIWWEEGFNSAFFSEFDTFFSENFGFRPLLVTADAALKAGLLRDSANAKVIVGQDGWLYFGETLDDYLGRNLLTPDEIGRIARTLALQREALAARGAAFLVALAPNKNTVYPEHMPSRYRPESAGRNLDALQAALAEAGVPFADLKAAMLGARQTAQAYHRLDSHWNNYGALEAFRAIMEALAARMPVLAWDGWEGAGYRIEKTWAGDLSTMLYPSLRLLDEQVIYDIPVSYRAVRPFRSPEEMRIETGSDANDTGLLMFRDSFCNALIPFFSNAFGRVLYSRAVPYDYGLLGETGADAVIIEIVERNIPELLRFAPLLQSPWREIPPSAAGSLEACAGERMAGNGRAVYGAADAEGVLLVRLTGPGDACFEPYPALSADDAALLPESYGNGFTLYLEDGELTPGEYAVSVVAEDGVSSGTILTITIS